MNIDLDHTHCRVHISKGLCLLLLLDLIVEFHHIGIQITLLYFMKLWAAIFDQRVFLTHLSDDVLEEERVNTFLSKDVLHYLLNSKQTAHKISHFEQKEWKIRVFNR